MADYLWPGLPGVLTKILRNSFYTNLRRRKIPRCCRRFGPASPSGFRTEYGTGLCRKLHPLATAMPNRAAKNYVME
ncbi:hypothetical protein, partial [uncultured Desulfovibrio sp.]|uniref:hypothetical protein n=1 Tax=uncultured Desulfovibrio sp. TaxID=167968 RepID=UPI0026292C43